MKSWATAGGGDGEDAVEPRWEVVLMGAGRLMLSAWGARMPSTSVRDKLADEV